MAVVATGVTMRTVVVAVALLAAEVPAALSQGCPSYDTLHRTVYLPQSQECTSFWRCDAGRRVPGRCPPGLHFSVELQRCVDPSMVAPCQASCPSPDTSCDYRCTCLRAEHTSFCPYRLQFPADLVVVRTPLHPACPAEPSRFPLGGDRLAHLATRSAAATEVSMCDVRAGQARSPHWADCSQGVVCSPSGQEVAVICPAGQLYDDRLGRCDVEGRVNCSTAPRGRAGSPLSSCRHTCTCEVQQGGCPARLRFSAKLAVYDVARQAAYLSGPAIIKLDKQYSGTLTVHANLTKVNHCPYSQEQTAKYFPDPWDCQKMFQCYHGRETSLNCPQGQHFNPEMRKCGEPDPEVCQTDVLPATVQTPPPQMTGDNITCPATVACPAGSRGRVAHPTDCTSFCKCTHGTPFLRACAPGLHFNALTRVCDNPRRAGCKTLCDRLSAPVGGTWSRPECVTAESKENEECRLTCDKNHLLIGSEFVTCTKKGWHGTGGLSLIPSCKTPQEVAVDLVGKINETLNQAKQETALLFILDESQSVKTTNFEIEKDFVSAIVNIFPLSQERSAGVLTFSKRSAVDISLTETSTCSLLSRLTDIRYSSGRTDIARVLEVATEEINSHASNKTTLVFLITDGKSQTDPVAAAQVLRSKDRILFIIGVARYDRGQVEPISSTYRDGSKLFFGLPNFRVFKVVSDYLRTTYTLGATQRCA